MTALQLISRVTVLNPGRKVFVDHVVKHYGMDYKAPKQYELYIMLIFSADGDSVEHECKGCSWDEVYAEYCKTTTH